MSAGASPAIGRGRAASGQRRISVEGWHAHPLDERACPTLADGELHIWSTDLEHARRPGIVDAEQLDVLSHEELERASQMVRPHARRRWLAARAFLRTLLGGYLEQDPRLLVFSTHSRGKPVLAEQANRVLHFNLSHSGRLAVCALTRMCAVGIDVQLPPRDLNARRLGQRLLEPEEAERLDLLEPDEQRRQALRAWVAGEAESKRTGVGLGGVGVGLGGSVNGERLSGPQPWLAQLELDDGCAGAIALALQPSQIGVGSLTLETSF